MGKTARLFYDDSEGNADLFYLTGFLAGDPFLYLEEGGRKTLFLSDLEVDRGRSQSRADEVVRLEDVSAAVKKDLPELPRDPLARIGLYVRRIALDRGIDFLEVPHSMPVGLADTLRAHGLGLRWIPAPVVPARTRKSREEVKAIRKAVAHAEASMQAAIDRIARAEIRRGGLYEGKEPLTSEMVRFTIESTLLERGCHAYDPIVAGGDQGVDPHERGHGPLPAHLPILLDIFPRDRASRYHGDITRTVVRGKASAEAKRMFAAVKDAKEAAESKLRAGADGFDVHQAVKKTFAAFGFETKRRGGRMVGFFHGTGHGLGLDVHEHPRVSEVHQTLEAGHVVTIEPGLYYPGPGGVRLEDDLLVTARGCERLGSLGEVFELP